MWLAVHIAMVKYCCSFASVLADCGKHFHWLMPLW